MLLIFLQKSPQVILTDFHEWLHSCPQHPWVYSTWQISRGPPALLVVTTPLGRGPLWRLLTWMTCAWIWTSRKCTHYTIGITMCCFMSRSFIQHFVCVKFGHIVASTYSSFFFNFCYNNIHCVTIPQFVCPSLLMMDVCLVQYHGC